MGENKIARALLIPLMHNSVTLRIYRKNMYLFRNKKKSEDADKAPLPAKLKTKSKKHTLYSSCVTLSQSCI